MALFYTAKKNLLAKFKARFSPNPKGEGYLFYPKEYDQGYACSETDYLKFTSDFKNFLKWMTWVMWGWFLLGMPIIIGLAFWKDYDFKTIEQFCIIMFPFPFLAVKGWQVYNAPNILTVVKRPLGRLKSQEQIMETRIKGMSWSMLLAMVVVPLIGSYVFLNDDGSLADWKVSLAFCLLISLFVFGIYLIVRKWNISRKRK